MYLLEVVLNSNLVGVLVLRFLTEDERELLFSQSFFLYDDLQPLDFPFEDLDLSLHPDRFFRELCFGVHFRFFCPEFDLTISRSRLRPGGDFAYGDSGTGDFLHWTTWKALRGEPRMNDL